VKLDVASTYGFALWKERTVPFPPYFGEVAGGRRKRGRNKRVIVCYRGPFDLSGIPDKLTGEPAEYWVCVADVYALLDPTPDDPK